LHSNKASPIASPVYVGDTVSILVFPFFSLRRALAIGDNLKWLKTATLVPVPPSKAKDDPLYDDRMRRVPQVLGRDLDLDIRELVLQRTSMGPSHESEARPTPEQVAENYYIDEERTDPEPRQIGIFDDLLTAGCHFRAMKTVLLERFPEAAIVGVFLARRVPETTTDFDELF